MSDCGCGFMGSNFVHFAAETHVCRLITDPAPSVCANVEGAVRLLGAVRKCGVRFHHVFTDEVFGDLLSDLSKRFTEAASD